MISADIFLYVENFLGAALGLLHSVIFSTVILARHPKSGPRFLTRRLKDDKIRQAGPLSICFVFILLGMLPIYFLLNVDIKGMLSAIFVDENKISVFRVLGTCFVGAVLVDLCGRVCAAFGWPRRFINQDRFKRREKESIRKTRLCYHLVIPILFGSICFSLCPLVAAVGIFYIKISFWDHFIHLILFGLSLWAVCTFVSIRLLHPHLIFHVHKKFGDGPHSRGELCLREIIFPSIIIVQISALLLFYNNSGSFYPAKEIKIATYTDDVTARALKCRYSPKNTIRIDMLISNDSVNSKVFKQSGNFRIKEIGMEENDSTEKLEFNKAIEFKSKDGSESPLEIPAKSNKFLTIYANDSGVDHSRSYNCSYTFDSYMGDDLQSDIAYLQDN